MATKHRRDLRVGGAQDAGDRTPLLEALAITGNRHRSGICPGSTRSLPAPSTATRRTASRASCTCWARFPGRSGMYWCRIWATPASTGSRSTKASAAPFKRSTTAPSSGAGSPDRRGILQRRGDRRLDADERQQPRFLRPAAGAGQHRTVPAQHGPSRRRRQSRGLDAGQLRRDSGAAGSRDWAPSCSSTSAT